MSSGVFIAAALGGGAALALVVSSRKKAAEPAPGAPASSDDACAALKGVNSTAYDACRAGTGIWKIFGAVAQYFDPKFKERDVGNIAKNGEVEIPLSSGAQSCIGWATMNGGSVGYQPLQGTVLKFKNGCVPFAGARGWEKCAAGTSSMWGGSGNVSWGHDPNQKDFPSGNYEMIAADLMLGSHTAETDRSDGNKMLYRGDPATGMLFPGSFSGKCGKNFPLTIPVGGTAGYYRGHPFTCPANTTPQLVKVAANTPYAPPKCAANRPATTNNGGTWNPWPTDVEPTPRPRGGIVVTSTPRT